MSKVVKFGNVIRHKEQNFVYLAATDEVVYLARLFDKADEFRNKVEDLYKRVATQGSWSAGRRLQNKLYSYVILSTEEYKDQMAHFARTDHEGTRVQLLEILGDLNTEDIHEIKEEIMRDGSVAPRQLRDIVKNIDISSM